MSSLYLYFTISDIFYLYLFTNNTALFRATVIFGAGNLEIKRASKHV
jgi:hypothetical protein